MTIKQQLWEEIESSSDELLLETLDFLQYLKTKNSNKSKPQKPLDSTDKSLLKHLDSLPNWEGDDLPDCFSAIKQTRAEAKFNELNPFDEEES